MGKDSAIEWTDHTFNPWWGCTKVSPGCDNCYAEAFSHRLGHDVWGPGKPRRFIDANSDYWLQVFSWDAAARKRGRRARVFCASMADVFDNEVEQIHRDNLFALIRATPMLLWILVTKRIGNAPKMLPADWGEGYENVILVATVCNQAEADRDATKLQAIPARARGLSIEPMLGPIDLYRGGFSFLHRLTSPQGRVIPALDWIIVGGESGKAKKDARPIQPLHWEWARQIRDQCTAAGVPFFFKQWGEYAPTIEVFPSCRRSDGSLNYAHHVRTGKKEAGRDLDGKHHNAFPEQLLCPTPSPTTN